MANAEFFIIILLTRFSFPLLFFLFLFPSPPYFYISFHIIHLTSLTLSFLLTSNTPAANPTSHHTCFPPTPLLTPLCPHTTPVIPYVSLSYSLYTPARMPSRHTCFSLHLPLLLRKHLSKSPHNTLPIHFPLLRVTHPSQQYSHTTPMTTLPSLPRCRWLSRRMRTRTT